MIDTEQLAKEFERLAFMARNGKLTGFLGLAWNEKGQYHEMYHIEGERRLGAIGAAAMLARGVETLTDKTNVNCLLGFCQEGDEHQYFIDE